MKEVPLDKCKWCNGSGTDPDGKAMGAYYKCVDCRGTGFKHGDEAVEYEDYLIDKAYEDSLKK